MLRKTLSNTRARFQRLRDAKLFTGWVKHFTKSSVVVVTPKEYDCMSGDEFVFHVLGPGSVAIFRSVLEYCHGTELSLRLISDVQFSEAKEEMRLLVDGTTGKLTVGGSEIDVIVVDVSANGAGVLCSCEIAKDTDVELHVDSTLGLVSVAGQVRYCRPVDDGFEQYRIGMSLKPHSRVDVARWQRLLSSEAA